MIKEFERQLVERYKRYYKDYDKFKKTPSSCEAGHLQEISWILHELFGCTDKDMKELVDEIRADILRNSISNDEREDLL